MGKNTEENKEEKREKVFFTGKSRKEKRKRSPLVIVLLILLLGVMAFSGYKIVDQLLIYKKGQDSYNDLRDQVVGTQDAPSTVASLVWNVPASEPTAPATLAAETLSGAQASSAMDYEDPFGTYSPTGATKRPGHDSDTEDQRGDITFDPDETYSNEPKPLPWLTVDFASLKSQNEGVKAWLYGMDGIVNYPVVQGWDNEYYVHRLLNGQEQFCGTLFVDYRNNFLHDDVTYIYGHKMKDGSMFGQFGRYDSYQYYQSHPAFRLFTPDATYELQVVACVYTTANEPVILNYANEWEFNAAMDNYRQRSMFQTAVDVHYGDHLVSLFTCAYYVENGRMFVLCKAVRIV